MRKAATNPSVHPQVALVIASASWFLFYHRQQQQQQQQQQQRDAKQQRHYRWLRWEGHEQKPQLHQRMARSQNSLCYCEGSFGASSKYSSHKALTEGNNNSSGSEDNDDDSTIAPPSWMQWALYHVGLASLPVPRRIVRGDPALKLEDRHVRQRQTDDAKLKALQTRIHDAMHVRKDPDAVGELLQESYAILYGKVHHEPNSSGDEEQTTTHSSTTSTTTTSTTDKPPPTSITPQQRQDFLQRYGCTGWTEEVLVTLLQLGAHRGFVEIGAGQGQWARILTDRYQQSDHYQQPQAAAAQKRHFDFVLAYDNGSALPLNPQVYHERTQPHHDFFFDRVRDCPSMAAVLRPWHTRGRILLLVYPGPDDMAVQALQEYVETAPQHNNMLVYVGEGRGGANANDAFFDALEESGDWILQTLLPVHRFGEKGHEQLYIFKRSPLKQQQPESKAPKENS